MPKVQLWPFQFYGTGRNRTLRHCTGSCKVGGWSELLFVNSMGLPFNTGVIVYIIILAASIIWEYTKVIRKPAAHA